MFSSQHSRTSHSGCLYSKPWCHLRTKVCTRLRWRGTRYQGFGKGSCMKTGASMHRLWLKVAHPVITGKPNSEDYSQMEPHSGLRCICINKTQGCGRHRCAGGRTMSEGVPKLSLSWGHCRV